MLLNFGKLTSRATSTCFEFRFFTFVATDLIVAKLPSLDRFQSRLRLVAFLQNMDACNVLCSCGASLLTKGVG